MHFCNFFTHLNIFKDKIKVMNNVSILKLIMLILKINTLKNKIFIYLFIFA